MNCQHAQKEMQKALDRRLPQSEQRAFQEHVLACKPCSLEFDRFNKLQAWTRELPSTKPASDFSKHLFERIQSGEGSPEAGLLEPVAITRKLRIFTSGALTAAALLLGAFLIFETLNDQQPDEGSNHPIVYEPTRPNPTLVSDPVKGAEMAIANAVVNFETARSLQSVPQINRRTLDSIRERGQDIESNMELFARLLQSGEIRLAMESTQGAEFRESMERLRAQARLMMNFPQDWLQLQFAERQQGANSVLFIIQMGEGMDPSTRMLRRTLIVPGKPRRR